MENYIIRIYRRNGEKKAVAGIVEVVGTQEEKPFKTHEELLAILDMAETGATIIWETK
jgi:ribonuclease PH